MGARALQFLRVLVMAAAAASATAPGGPATAAPREVLAGPVPAEVVAVIDGDTLVVRARIWLGQRLETRVRLRGIDAPELHGKCPNERALARRAKARLAGLVGDRAVVLRDIRFGKYAGRVVARVETAADGDVGDLLRRGGLARSYGGGGRGGWCAAGPGRR